MAKNIIIVIIIHLLLLFLFVLTPGPILTGVLKVKKQPKIIYQGTFAHTPTEHEI